MELRRKRASTPQKPSRLQSSESSHMTTRAASKAASSNGGSSRRGSLISNGLISPSVINENDGERYPKRRRISTGSKSTPSGASHSSQASSTASRPSTRSMSGGNLHPIAESPIPRRKRKRSSNATAENISVAQPAKEIDEVEEAIESPLSTRQSRQKSQSSYNSSADKPEDRDTLSDTQDSRNIQDSATEPVERHGGSSASHEEINHHVIDIVINGTTNGTSNNAMADVEAEVPVEGDGRDSSQLEGRLEDQKVDKQHPDAVQADDEHSEEALDGSGEVDNSQGLEGEEEDAEGDSEDDAEMDVSQDALTLPKQLGIATMDPTPAVSTVASPTGSFGESNADRESPIKRMASMPGIEVTAIASEGDKPTRRLPGRRRAPHAIPKVEAALRRQLHLRMAYRAVAKNLKPILTELSKRSLNKIHEDSEAYAKLSEYAVVKEGLHQHFEQRLAWIQTQKDLNKTRLQDVLQEQTEMRRRQHEHVARTIQEDFVVLVKRDFVQKLRDQQQEVDDDYSDDENGDVIPALRRVTRKGGVGSILGPEYHCRSRPVLETERLFDELQERDRVAREHYDHDKASALADSRPFTSFDPTQREAANILRTIGDLVSALEEASREASKPLSAPVAPQPLPPLPPSTISNNDATGLQLLAAALDMNLAAPIASSETAGTISRIDLPAEVQRQEDLTVPRPSMSRAESQSTTAPSVQKETPASVLEESEPEQRQATTVPISFSQAVLEPSIKETAPPVSRPSVQPEAQAGPTLPSIDQVVASHAHDNTLPPQTASLPAPTPSKPVATDFWSSLARGSYETDAHGKVKLAPTSNTSQQGHASNEGPGLESAKIEERTSGPPLAASSTVLEPLSQRLRSTSDSFGPLLDRPAFMESPRYNKSGPPKKSLYGPWPRSRNYNPLDRRSSTTGSQESLPGINSRPGSGFGGPYSSGDANHHGYAPPGLPQIQGFPTSSGGYPPGSVYSAAPSQAPHTPYTYDQRGQPYPSLAPYGTPPGYPGLAGAPQQQQQQPPPPPPPPYYGGPHGLPPPPHGPGSYPPMSSRPPGASPAYGPQYGGQPILPANPDPRFASNGTPTTGAAGPAFAQYQQHDGRRRRNQSLGHREFQHYQGPR